MPERAVYALLIAIAMMSTIAGAGSVGESHPVIREEGSQAVEGATAPVETHLAVAKVPNNKTTAQSSKTVHGLQLDAVRKIEIQKLAHSAAHHPIKIDAKAKQRIQSLIATVSKEFESTTAKSKAMAKAMKRAAQKRSAAMQHQAKVKAAAVVAKARKTLQTTLTKLQTTLTSSVDARQQAAEKLKELQGKQADEVQLAEASLALAKVNKATHSANTDARKAAKRAHNKARARIHFARSMLATRLKAITTTERLMVNKAELQANVVRTEAEEALSKTRQQVLLELDDSDDTVSLAELIGQDAVAQEVTSKDSSRDRAVSRMSDEELLSTGAKAHAPADTIYTAKMGICKFPFVYNGEKLYHCKSSKAGHWCATATDETHAVKKWDYCVQNSQVVLLAQEAAMRAAKIEISRVLSETGEHAMTPAALRESLRAAAAARTGPTEAPAQEALSKAPVDAAQAAKDVDAMINGQ